MLIKLYQQLKYFTIQTERNYFIIQLFPTQSVTDILLCDCHVSNTKEDYLYYEFANLQKGPGLPRWFGGYGIEKYVEINFSENFCKTLSEFSEKFSHNFYKIERKKSRKTFADKI